MGLRVGALQQGQGTTRTCFPPALSVALGRAVPPLWQGPTGSPEAKAGPRQHTIGPLPRPRPPTREVCARHPARADTGTARDATKALRRAINPDEARSCSEYASWNPLPWNPLPMEPQPAEPSSCRGTPAHATELVPGVLTRQTSGARAADGRGQTHQPPSRTAWASTVLPSPRPSASKAHPVPLPHTSPGP